MTQTQQRGARVRTPDPEVDGEGWLARARQSFASPAGLVALLLIAVQAVWRGSAVADGFYTQDDYLALLHADQGSPSLEHLTELHSAELSPVANLITWVTVQVGGIGWGSVVVVVVLLQAVAAALAWVLLSQVLEERWVRLPLLAVALFTPLTLASTMTWSLAAMHLPTTVLVLTGLSALVAHVRDGWAPGPRVAGAAFVLVLLCSDRSLFLPLTAFFVVAAIYEPASARVGERLARAVTDHLRLWAVLVVAVVVRVLLGTLQDKGSFALPDSSGAAVDVVEQYARQGLSGLVGGPWVGTPTNGVLYPDATWPLLVSAFLCVLCAVPIIRSLRSPSVTVAAIGLVVSFAGGAAILLLTQDTVSALAMVPRVLADTVVPVVALVAIALRGARVPEQVAPFVVRGPFLAALVLVAAVTASSVVTTRALLPDLKNADDRAYMTNLRAGLGFDPRVVLVDGPVPETIIHPWHGARARVSTLTEFLPEQPTFGVPSEFLRMVDGFGLLREIDLAGTVSAPEGPTAGCGWSADANGVSISFPQAVPEGEQVLEIGYFAGQDTYAQLEVGSREVRVPIRQGLHVVQVPTTGDFAGIKIRTETVGTVACIGHVDVGTATAAPLKPVE